MMLSGVKNALCIYYFQGKYILKKLEKFPKSVVPKDLYTIFMQELLVLV